MNHFQLLISRMSKESQQRQELTSRLSMIQRVFDFVWVDALHPSQQFFSHFGMFSWVEPVLSNENEVSCSRTQHHAPGEIQPCHYTTVEEIRCVLDDI